MNTVITGSSRWRDSELSAPLRVSSAPPSTAVRTLSRASGGPSGLCHRPETRPDPLAPAAGVYLPVCPYETGIPVCVCKGSRPARRGIRRAWSPCPRGAATWPRASSGQCPRQRRRGAALGAAGTAPGAGSPAETRGPRCPHQGRTGVWSGPSGPAGAADSGTVLGRKGSVPASEPATSRRSQTSQPT